MINEMCLPLQSKARAYQGDATCHAAVLEDKLMQDLSKRGMEAGWLAIMFAGKTKKYYCI
jgi:hypothetical protein